MLEWFSEERYFDKASAILDSENSVGLWSEGKRAIQNWFSLANFELTELMYGNNNY